MFIKMKKCEKMFGEIEIDESYFGAKWVRGYRGKLKRDRGTLKQPVGLLKRDGRVYTQIIPNCKKPVLQAIIKGKIDKTAIIYWMDGEDMTNWWMLVSINTLGLIMVPMNFQKDKIFISTVLKISEASLSDD